jgi:hypothetical protein
MARAAVYVPPGSVPRRCIALPDETKPNIPEFISKYVPATVPLLLMPAALPLTQSAVLHRLIIV